MVILINDLFLREVPKETCLMASDTRYLDVILLISLIGAFTKQLRLSQFSLVSCQAFTDIINDRCFSKAFNCSNSIFSFLNLPRIYDIPIFYLSFDSGVISISILYCSFALQNLSDESFIKWLTSLSWGGSQMLIVEYLFAKRS